MPATNTCTGLRAELVGDRDRLITLADLQELQVRLGALLLELPQREIGGRLPEWDELVGQIEWARARDVPTHLDGARIWEAAPYYGRPHAELAGLFDTVYVSLYKGLGGIGGSVLAGPAELIAQARVWRRRHGGTLPNLFGFVAGCAARARPAGRTDAGVPGACPGARRGAARGSRGRRRARPAADAAVPSASARRPRAAGCDGRWSWRVSVGCGCSRRRRCAPPTSTGSQSSSSTSASRRWQISPAEAAELFSIVLGVG